MKILQINADGLRNKVGELDILVLNDPAINIICISEHWLVQAELETFSIHGFTLAHGFCRTRKEHGGVAIFVRHFLKFECCNSGMSCEELDFELCAINLIDFNLRIFSIYRSPDGDIHNFFDKFNVLLNKNFNTNDKIIITGDFNIDYLTNNRNKIEFEAITYSYGFNILVAEPTRVTKTSATCIDNVISNLDSSSINTQVKEIYLSDHRAIFTSFNHKSKKKQIKINRNKASHRGEN